MNPNDISSPDPNKEFTQTPDLPKVMSTPSLSDIGTDHTIQPISPEAKIQQAVVENTPNTTLNSALINSQSLSQGTGQASNETYNNPTNINPTPLVAPAISVPNDDLSTQPTKKKHKWLIIPIIILALLSAGYFAYRYFHASAPLLSLSSVIGSTETLKVKDLVSEYAFKTNFQRPKQWVAVDKSGGYYRDPSGTDNNFVAYVYIIYGDKYPKLINASDAVYEMQRNSPLPTILDIGAQKFIEGTGQICTSKPIEKAAADSYVISDSIGLFLKTATCPTNQGGVTAKERTIISKDGYMRSIIIVAPNKQWSIDNEVFNTMLNSIQQS